MAKISITKTKEMILSLSIASSLAQYSFSNILTEILVDENFTFVFPFYLFSS